jgi:hypothetical protein
MKARQNKGRGKFAAPCVYFKTRRGLVLHAAEAVCVLDIGFGFAEVVIFSWHDGIQEDANDGADGEARERKFDAAQVEANRTRLGEADAQGADNRDCADEHVAGLGEVNLMFDEVANADRGNHTVEDERNAADGGRREGRDDRGKFRTESEDDRKNCRDANDARIVDFRERKDARVFTIGRVGRRAKNCREGGRKAVAKERAVEAWVREEVALDGGANRGDIADVFHHGGGGERRNDENGADDTADIIAGVGEDREDSLVPMEWEADPRCRGDVREVDCGAPASDIAIKECREVADDDADENRDNFDHALAKDRGEDDRDDASDGDWPAGRGAIDRDWRKDETDADYDWACHDGREETHDPLDTDRLHDRGKNYIDETRDNDADRGVGEEVRLREVFPAWLTFHRGQSKVAGEERKGRTEEGWHDALREEVEEERARTREEQSRGNGKTRQKRNENRRAKHSEKVLHTEDAHFGNAKGARIVNGFCRGLCCCFL